MENIRKTEKVICMILEDINSDFSKELVKSVANAISEKKQIRLVVLPVKYDYGIEDNSLHKYREIYNNILRFSEICSIDGLIIHLGSVSERDKDSHGIVDELLERLADIPKVLVASDLKDAVTVNYNNENGIREAIEFIANIEGLTKICMLGGRDDNKDARDRKEIFIKCLHDYRLEYSEDQFENTDMSEDSFAAAERLLDRNPNVQAIFCINDAVAKGLYTTLKARGKIIGRDIMVFGFDNTRMSSDLDPPLSSVGADSSSLGGRALELLLSIINGEEARSDTVPTRLYGRASMPYETYEYNPIELSKAEPAFIYKMFNDCFYRYKLESIDRENVDLKRLFFEFMSKMLTACKHSYMDVETFGKLNMMIDKFFEKGAMRYTDSTKLTTSIEKIQNIMNKNARSLAATVFINRLFARMKDRAIVNQSKELISHERKTNRVRQQIKEFIVSCMDKTGCSMYRNFDKLGLDNALLFIFEKPIVHDLGEETLLPKNILLKCMMHMGDLYLMPEERQKFRVEDIFGCNKLTMKCNGFVSFPVICGRRLFGLLMCELTDDICENGEFIAMELGRSLALSEQ
ncbi:LacI family DNA-binding transcriptional regulator [Ruminococcus albus]|uniref:DNA-binding transcriptional regulator, LacI/PurR family n=1 Tax=Ruminococcus albus TaxID=1264 RepID=A0A1H7NWY0_RUMAL|nr:LacI family DNA-binding transcriptional regulator [Ruminococcus albus]SEL27387.1 DNA-binding transcriptional regulator, LacI/PurR family [Ruminococcus albus]